MKAAGLDEKQNTEAYNSEFRIDVIIYAQFTTNARIWQLQKLFP